MIFFSNVYFNSLKCFYIKLVSNLTVSGYIFQCRLLKTDYEIHEGFNKYKDCI